MKDQRPYLLRGLLDWILDSDCTPHILVAANAPGVMVPAEQVEDGRIVLNISPGAVRDFVLGDELIEFECRFSGIAHRLSIPIRAVLAIYARENGAGMAFQAVDDPEADAGAPAAGDDGPEDDGPDSGGGPSLRVVK